MKKIAYVCLTYLYTYEQEDSETDKEFEERVDRAAHEAGQMTPHPYGEANDIEISYGG